MSWFPTQSLFRDVLEHSRKCSKFFLVCPSFLFSTWLNSFKHISLYLPFCYTNFRPNITIDNIMSILYFVIYFNSVLKVLKIWFYVFFSTFLIDELNFFSCKSFSLRAIISVGQSELETIHVEVNEIKSSRSQMLRNSLEW